MQALRSIGFLIVLMLPSLLFAQDQKAEDAAKEKQRRRNALIEQVLTDLPDLKLGENRAIVYSKIGNLIWDSDQKRARSFFQSSIGELINAQMLAESTQKRTTYQSELLTGGATRPQILNTIASRDAAFALDLLFKTRTAAILKALSRSAEKSSKINNNTNSAYLAQNEANLEQSFVRLAAEQNPERAARLLKESLSKGISNETLNLLKKLAETETESAAGLAATIVDKLIQRKFNVDNQPNYQTLQIAVAFLNEFIADKAPSDRALKLDSSQMHRLADKLFSYYLDGQNRENYYLGYSVIPIAEKLSPSIVEQLKKVAKNNPRQGIYSDPDLQKLLSGDVSGDQLLAEAKKYPLNIRRQIYQAAANKMAQQGDIGRATDVLNDNFSDDALDESVRNLNSQYSYNLMNSGKFAEAERVIDELPENVRGNSLVSLANAVYQIDPVENKSHAVSILGKARSLIPEKPENGADMGNLMQIITAFSNIDPSGAISMFEQLVPQLNELSDAAAVMNEFQGNGNVREKEFSITQGNSFGFYGPDYSMFPAFARHDYDRTIKLIDSFTRREIRISLKIHLAENGLN